VATSFEPYRFYAAEVSYFSGKVRPALRAKGVPFCELLPDYRNVIVPRTGLAFIPIVVTPEDETWQDTSEILDALEARFPEPALYPSTPTQQIAAHLFELYADEFLLLPAMHYRWSFPESEAKARGDFAALVGDRAASDRFADQMKGSRAVLGIAGTTVPGIEAHLAELLAALESHFEKHPFLLGGALSLADCSLLGPCYAHLYLDAVPGRLLRASAPRTCHWIERANHCDPTAAGVWLAGDALPATLRPVLELIGRDAAPWILDGVRAFERWADAEPEGSRAGEVGRDEPPRFCGRVASALRGASVERAVSSYTLWMLQRVLDRFDALPAAQRARVRAALAGTGCELLLDYQPRHSLGKRRFKLICEGPGRPRPRA
jgi:glutathione S-transferase